ncbi:MAG: hypothetical protein MUO67_19350 [Anaerolineales bacterium]|nr:hypothetical protein [Anaerolineales bacterium]
MKRPAGVTLIAFLALISGLFGLCWPILAFMGSALFGGILGTVGAIAGIFLLIGVRYYSWSSPMALSGYAPGLGIWALSPAVLP